MKNSAEDKGTPLTKEQILATLKSCDINHDGQLNRQELKEAFRRLGADFPLVKANRALWNADANGDGCISEEELNEVVKFVMDS